MALKCGLQYQMEINISYLNEILNLVDEDKNNKTRERKY